MSDRPFPIRLFAFAFLGWTFDFYDLVLLGFVKHPVGEALHLSAAQEQWILGVALGASGIGGLVAGYLADRFGARRVLSLTVLLYSAGSLVSGLAPNAWVFILGRGLVGLGVGGEWAVGHAALAESVGDARRGRAASYLQAGEPTGVALAAFAGYVLVPAFGWRKVMVGSSATALLAALMRASVHIPDVPSASVPWAKVRQAKLGSTMARAWVLGVLKLGTYWTCYTWLPGFLSEQMHQSVGQSLIWIFTAQGGQLLGMLSFGQVADRLGRRIAFSAYSLLTASALLPVAFAWHSLLQQPALFWAAMFLLGVGSGCTAGFGALLAELYPLEVRKLAMGATYNLARSAQLFAPRVVGYMVGLYGVAGGLSVPVMLALGTAAWVWTLPETRGIALPSFEPPART